MENHVLSRLNRKDQDLLRPYLQATDLRLHARLQAPHRPVTDVYFVDTGVASVLWGAEPIEVGMIGHEGISGIAGVLGRNNVEVPYETRMLIAGTGRRVSVRYLRQAMEASDSLTAVLLGCANDFINQLANTAFAHATCSVEKRLARWLLMMDDRTGGQALPVTHEALAAVLGVRRSGVSIALKALRNRDYITRTRGTISLVGRTGMERFAADAYVRPKVHEPRHQRSSSSSA